MNRTLGELLGYLERYRIEIIQEGEVTSFRRPGYMDRAEYLDRVAEIGADAKRLKVELLAHLAGGGSGWVAKDADWQYVRREITAKLVADSKLLGLRVGWYSLYDMSTGYLHRDAKVFPRHATHGRLCFDSREGLPVDLCMPYISSGYVHPKCEPWVYLPYSCPKQKKSPKLKCLVFRSPWWWKPPPNWCQPRRWIPAEKPKKLIRKEYAERWKHDKPPENMLPD